MIYRMVPFPMTSGVP